MIKNSQPFAKNFRKTVGGGFFLTHTVQQKTNYELLKTQF